MSRLSAVHMVDRSRLAVLSRLAELLSRRACVVTSSCVVGLGYAATASDALNGDRVVLLVVSLALSAVHGAALMWRHSRPVTVMTVVVPVDLLFLVVVPEMVIPFASLIALWRLTRVGPAGRSLVGLGAVLAVVSVNFVTTTAGEALFTMVVAVSVWALAEGARNRGDAIDAAARRAVSEEQARIARELHDVIAHTVSVMVVQAAAARDVFDARPEQARAALGSIEDSGRDALVELRRLLAAVRTEGSGDAIDRSAPQPGLDRLAELTEPLRTAGLEVVVNYDGSRSPLPVGVDLSAFRIVQEALTNTLRHARASLAEITFRYGPDVLEIDIVDDGRGESHRPTGGAHYGLIGMRERAALVGGTLEAGPTAHGGYRVLARLPLGAPA